MIVRSAGALCLLAVIGCGRADDAPPQASIGQDAESTALSQQDVSAVDAHRTYRETDGKTDGETETLPADVAASDRKIIYHAQIRIDVTDFGEAAAGVESLISRHGGFVASSRLGGQSGSTRSGQWTLRVPVGRYRAFVNELTHLGELREQHETSKEVTAQFFDLEARVRNKQQEEQRLLTHLDKTTRQLPEILAIEREISRVRGEIEQMQGRLKLLADQTSLSTIVLTISEIETFVPAVSPTFPTRITRAWAGSTETLLSVLEGIAVFATAAVPWIAVLALFGAVLLPITLAIRRRLTVPTR